MKTFVGSIRKSQQEVTLVNSIGDQISPKNWQEPIGIGVKTQGEPVCLDICLLRRGWSSQILWLTNLAVIGEAGGVKRTSEKYQKTPPTALIISTVLVDISIYSLVVSIIDCITYSAWHGP